MSWKVPLADLDYDASEEEAVLAVLRRRWLTMGSETQAFEAEFAEFVGAKHAFAVTNCTAALHMAYEALGLKAGDEVIVPSLTFVATANAVTYTGATPVFADVTSESDFSISPDDIEAKITPRTKAIVVVHFGGYPCDMLRIQAIAKAHNLYIVEDAAHTPGSELDGRQLGTWGDVGCYSFFSNKNMATGEGGMLTTDDDEIAEQFRLLRSHGMTTLTWDRHKGRASTYEVLLPGYNYRIDEIRSALGRTQLKKLPKNNAKRSELNQYYVEMLTELAPDVGIPYQDHRGVSSCHIRPILLPPNTDRHQFMAKMKELGIQTSIHYPPAHEFDYYQQNAPATLPMTEKIARREITLPLYPGMSSADVLTVTSAVQQALSTLNDSQS
ncbi:MAG: DegT/DnrJ/EryC1/StrS family aminotransferase [Candidatus Promineifilaceae bacterium]